jgi:hypothetical protein
LLILFSLFPDVGNFWLLMLFNLLPGDNGMLSLLGLLSSYSIIFDYSYFMFENYMLVGVYLDDIMLHCIGDFIF